MRLPYLQIAMEVIEQAAPDLAVALDWTEEAAGWGLVRLFRWGLARCPDHQPPSAGAVVEGPLAARLIANAAGWKGDPEAFVAALEHVRPEALVERVEGGIRLCGLSRYDAAWGKSHPEEWRAWRAKPTTPAPAPVPERIRNGSGPKPEQNRAGMAPVSEPQTQTQTQTHAQPISNSAREGAAGWWGWAQEARAKAFPNAMPETPPPDFLAWWGKACAVADEGRLRAAWERFLTEDYAHRLTPPAAARGFLGAHDRGHQGAWVRLVPGQTDGAAPPARKPQGGNGQPKRTIADSIYREGEVEL